MLSSEPLLRCAWVDGIYSWALDWWWVLASALTVPVIISFLWHIQNVRVVLVDGASHPVDSNELAFRVAAIQGFRQAYQQV